MTERKEIAKITYIIDHDTGIYHIGEVDGGFQDDQLKDFISVYGVNELLNKLAHMTSQVVLAGRHINYEKNMQESLANDSLL